MKDDYDQSCLHSARSARLTSVYLYLAALLHPSCRQFLKNVLPRLAYNNPGIPFHVTYLQQKQQETATEASQQAESSSSGSAEKKPKKEQQGSAVITIEYGESLFWHRRAVPTPSA